MKRMKLKRFLVLVILIIVTLTSFNCFGTDLNNPTNENDYDKIEYVDSYNILANYNDRKNANGEILPVIICDKVSTDENEINTFTIQSELLNSYITQATKNITLETTDSKQTLLESFL